MHSDLGEIKDIRKKYGLTQHELAKKAGVSQSLIAKIEADRIDPTYSKAQKVFDALKSLTEEKGLKAKDIMEKRVISIRLDDSVKEAIHKMKKYEISQMPVIKNKNVVGLVSETTILEKLSKIGPEESVEKIIDEAPPIITKNTSLKVITDLLKHFPILIVTEKGDIKGLITKSDLIRVVYRR